MTIERAIVLLVLVIIALIVIAFALNVLDTR